MELYKVWYYKQVKTAIILSGGGMRAAFCVGALLELHERGIRPDIVIAGSGSAGTGSYFVAGQFKSIPLIWTELLSTKKLIDRYRFKQIVNIDYLIDEVFKKQEPLDAGAVTGSIIEYLIPVTNVSSGEVEYLSNHEKGFEVFEYMRATMAYPLLYGKTIPIKGSMYSDGVFSASPYFHINKAKELGAEKIIVLDSGARTNKFLYRLWLFIKNKGFRKNQLSYLKRNNNDESKNLIIIKPLGKINFSILDIRKSTIISLINDGRESVKVTLSSR